MLENLHGRVFLKRGFTGEKEIIFEDKRFSRFMERFYICCATEELTPEEVSALCQERAKEPGAIGPANATVKDIFRALVEKIIPANFLEIGAGCNPILANSDPIVDRVRYVKSDADIYSANSLTMFSGQQCGLNFPQGYFDLAAAVFVLHFNFYENQIAELHRCLSVNGVFVANIYRRTADSRAALAAQFKKNGFLLKILPDPHNLCDHHEYWVLAKNIQALDTHQAELLAIINRAGLK